MGEALLGPICRQQAGELTSFSQQGMVCQDLAEIATLCPSAEPHQGISLPTHLCRSQAQPLHLPQPKLRTGEQLLQTPKDLFMLSLYTLWAELGSFQHLLPRTLTPPWKKPATGRIVPAGSLALGMGLARRTWSCFYQWKVTQI